MRSSRVWLMILAALVTFVAGLVLHVSRQISTLNSQRPGGFVNERAKWPKYLRETLEPLERKGIIEGPLEGFRPRAWSDDSFAVRFELKPDKLQALVAAMSLSSVTADHVSVRSFFPSIPTQWHISIDDPMADYFASPAWLNGDEGDMYVLRVDESTSVAHIFYYYNF